MNLYNELEQPIDKELQKLIDEYYENYLYFGWRILYSLDRILKLILILSSFYADANDPSNKSKIIVASLSALMFKGVDILKERYPRILKFIFPFCNFAVGFSLTMENAVLEEFRIYELWIVYYLMAFLISLIYCLHWKLIVIPFLFCQIFYGVMMYITFDKVNIFAYAMILFAFIVYPIV